MHTEFPARGVVFGRRCSASGVEYWTLSEIARGTSICGMNPSKRFLRRHAWCEIIHLTGRDESSCVEALFCRICVEEVHRGITPTSERLVACAPTICEKNTTRTV